MKTTKEFYSLMNVLPIGVKNQKIITFEKPLYDKYFPTEDSDSEIDAEEFAMRMKLENYV